MKQLLTREKRSSMRARLIITSVIVAVISAVAFAVPVERAVTVNVLDGNPDKIVIQYKLGDFTQKPVSINGQNFTEVYLGKEALRQEKGAPALPDVSRSIIIPDDARMAVSIVNSLYYEVQNVGIPPSKGNLLRNVNPADVPYTFGRVYQKDTFYPGALATLQEPYIMRDHRGITVTVSPFQYNPVQRLLRVYTEITLQITSTGKDSKNVLQQTGRKPKKSRAFHEIYSTQFINYSVETRAASLDEQGDMLIIAYDPWISNLQLLAEHKNSIGINTTIVGVSTIGNNSTSIKNYIQNVYNTSNLAYVLLVGDAAQVATPTASGGSSDPSYSKLAGSDNYPDIFVGRFSAENATNVDTQVLKTIEYENMPATQQEWFWRGVGIASSEGGTSTGDDGESDQQHIEGLRAQLLSYDYTLVNQIYEAAGATKADIANALNAGRGIINYCGHGSITAWGTTGFSVTDVAALINRNMLPFIFDVACVNGQFNGYTCFAEAWIRATSGGEPTGAIGIYASSINQSWAPPMEAQDTFNSLYIAGTYSSYGALCYAGSCSMMDKYGSGGVDMFNTWHIFGDPSLRIVGAVASDANIASNPSPADKATGVDTNIDISWTPGAYAGSHDVYLGTDYNAVANANYLSPEFKGNQLFDSNSYDPGPLAYNTTYYWSIDEVNGTDVWPGNIWSFTTVPLPPGQATNPGPTNGATGVGLTTDISWTAGTGATSHDVYFGTVNPPPFKVNQTGSTYDTGTMNANTTYYWHIDEKNAGGTTTGELWSFTTAASTTTTAAASTTSTASSTTSTASSTTSTASSTTSTASSTTSTASSTTSTAAPPPPPPEQASNPIPGDGAANVGLTTDISWTAGAGATSHDVYFGTTNPPTFRVNQTGTTYDTGTMNSNTTYYWRIDEKNAGGTTTGTVWSFTTTAVSAPPTFVAAGAVASGTGTIAPALPSGIASGDILLLFLETSNQAISISNSNGGTWTAVTNSPKSTGTAASSTGVRLTAFWSRYNGTQGAPTTSDSGDHQLGRIIAIRGAVASGNPWDVTAGGVEAVSDRSGSIPGATTTVANTLVVTAIATALPDATGTSNFSSWTNSNLTGITERTDNTVTAGNGGGIGIATGTKATTGTYGNTTVTCASSSYKAMISIAIKP